MSHVLVVDDNADERVRLKDLLPGFVWTARTLDEGLRLAAERPLNVICLDVWFDLDRRTGLDMLEAFQLACPPARLIILTELWSEIDQRRALARGAAAYAEKRDPVLILHLVEAALRAGGVDRPALH